MSDQRGQSLVETAVLLPFVIFLIFALVDLGRAAYSWNMIASAARNGARVAAVNQIEESTSRSDPAGDPVCETDRPVQNPASAYWSIKDCAASYARLLEIQPSAVDVGYATPPGSTLNCSPLRVGCIATVTVEYAFVPSTPLLTDLFGPIPMSASSQMPIERLFP